MRSKRVGSQKKAPVEASVPGAKARGLVGLKPYVNERQNCHQDTRCYH
jgi:hypothetical protein